MNCCSLEVARQGEAYLGSVHQSDQDDREQPTGISDCGSACGDDRAFEDDEAMAQKVRSHARGHSSSAAGSSGGILTPAAARAIGLDDVHVTMVLER
jgi:hypothetical protein